MSNDDTNEDDEKTLVRRKLPTVDEYEKLLDDLAERDELVKALEVPEEIDVLEHVAMLVELHRAVLIRAKLDRADPSQVALMATPESLLALVCGESLGPDNPLAKLAGTVRGT